MVTNNGLGSFGDALLAAAGAMLEADAEKVRTEPKVAVGDRLLHANGAVDRVLAIDGRMATLERIGKGAGYTHPGSKTTLPIADIHATLEFKGATVDTSGRAKQPDAATPAHAARGPSDAALDTTGTGIPTVETHDAIDKTGPSVEQPAPVVAATQATDATGAKEGPSLNAAIRDAKAERAHIAARIRPEADEQVDGKGRNLTTIDKGLDAEIKRIWASLNALRSANGARFDHIEQWMRGDAQPEFETIDRNYDAMARRIGRAELQIDGMESKLDRLIAARVSKPCDPSKATADNELATAIEAADWREALVPIQYANSSWHHTWWATPYGNVVTFDCQSGERWHELDWAKEGYKAVDIGSVRPEYIAVRDALPEPPNLSEWWPAKADDFKPTPEQQRFLASVYESCRSVVRAMLAKGNIPGVVKTNQS